MGILLVVAGIVGLSLKSYFPIQYGLSVGLIVAGAILLIGQAVLYFSALKTINETHESLRKDRLF